MVAVLLRNKPTSMGGDLWSPLRGRGLSFKAALFLRLFIAHSDWLNAACFSQPTPGRTKTTFKNSPALSIYYCIKTRQRAKSSIMALSVLPLDYTFILKF